MTLVCKVLGVGVGCSSPLWAAVRVGFSRNALQIAQPLRFSNSLDLAGHILQSSGSSGPERVWVKVINVKTCVDSR